MSEQSSLVSEEDAEEDEFDISLCAAEVGDDDFEDTTSAEVKAQTLQSSDAHRSKKWNHEL